MDWAAVSAIAAVLGLPLAYHLGTRRRKARIYAEPATGGSCRLVIENRSETPVVVSRVTALWPLSLEFSSKQFGPAPEPWLPEPELGTSWSRSITRTEIVQPDKTGYLDFEFRSDRPGSRMSHWIALHVDESRAMQISKIRVIKVLQIPATASQKPSMFIIG